MSVTHGYAQHDEHHGHTPGFVARWFFSTNHKDIGTLYLIFAVIGGTVGPRLGHRVNLIVRESRARATPPSCGFVWPRATRTLWRRPGETAGGGIGSRGFASSRFL